MLLWFGGAPSASLEGPPAHVSAQHWPHHRVEVIHLSLLSGPVLRAGHPLGALGLLLLLSRFSHVQLYATPQTAAHWAPLSLGFSRQEPSSGLPFPSPMHESEK